MQAIVNVIGMTKMTPPIKDLLPRLTPILKNRFVKSTNKQAHTTQFMLLLVTTLTLSILCVCVFVCVCVLCML